MIASLPFVFANHLEYNMQYTANLHNVCVSPISKRKSQLRKIKFNGVVLSKKRPAYETTNK